MTGLESAVLRWQSVWEGINQTRLATAPTSRKVGEEGQSPGFPLLSPCACHKHNFSIRAACSFQLWDATTSILHQTSLKVVWVLPTRPVREGSFDVEFPVLAQVGALQKVELYLTLR